MEEQLRRRAALGSPGGSAVSFRSLKNTADLADYAD
jgi:hypothetical protein